MSPEPLTRDEDLAQGRLGDASKLPRLLAGVVVLAIIAASIWALSGAAYPWEVRVPPAPTDVRVATIRSNLPDDPGKPTAARIGALAPDFEWQEPDGSRRRLSDLRGKVVVVNWWATWCPPCRAEMPALQRVARESPEVVVLAVDLQEDERQVLDFFERLALDNLKPVIDPNGQTARRYLVGGTGIPQTFFIGVDGTVRHIEPGGPMDDDLVRRGIAKARAG